MNRIRDELILEMIRELDGIGKGAVFYSLRRLRAQRRAGAFIRPGGEHRYHNRPHRIAGRKVFERFSNIAFVIDQAHGGLRRKSVKARRRHACRNPARFEL